MNDRVASLAKILWDYQRLNVSLSAANVIVAMGCEDVRVAERAVDLFKAHYGKWIICTGRASKYTSSMLNDAAYETEAAYFASIVKSLGVDESHILLEEKATNSGENIKYVKLLLHSMKIKAQNIIVVTAPYSERRQQATYAAQWPGVSVQITSPQLTFASYPTENLNYDYLINALVGRVQRMSLYSDLGLQIKTEIPASVQQAYEELLSMGYTKQLAI